MAKRLFKLVMSATTTTKAVPTVNRYFHPMSAAVTTTTTSLTILATTFTRDSGTAAATIVTAVASNGYYMLYVNGELQQSSLYTVAASRVILNLSTGLSIPQSGVVTLAVTNFAPTSSTSVSG